MGPVLLKMETFDALIDRLNEYAKRGYYLDCVAAIRFATSATREFIARTHPHVAFAGKILGDKQYIISKKYNAYVTGDRVTSVIYANYFARWYNTGAYGRLIRKRGPRFGQHGPSYPPRGSYFESNKTAIEDYFSKQVEIYLSEHMSL